MGQVFFSRQMAGLQEGEKEHVMFLKISAGNWHTDSSIQVPLAKASHKANPTSVRQGRSLSPQWDVLQTQGKEYGCITSNSRSKKYVGTITQLVTASKDNRNVCWSFRESYK